MSAGGALKKMETSQSSELARFWWKVSSSVRSNSKFLLPILCNASKFYRRTALCSCSQKRQWGGVFTRFLGKFEWRDKRHEAETAWKIYSVSSRSAGRSSLIHWNFPRKPSKCLACRPQHFDQSRGYGHIHFIPASYICKRPEADELLSVERDNMTPLRGIRGQYPNWIMLILILTKEDHSRT